jgi:two-component system alkaline phosphatase synthesis response regulator PhoP
MKNLQTRPASGQVQAMARNVLLVEDEPGLVLALTDLFTSEGYGVEIEEDGTAALETASHARFDAIILDVMLPGKNGLDVCRELRQKGIQTPILMLTARGQLVDKVLGLKLGADDYLTKPFESLELLARVEVLLRRSGVQTLTTASERYVFGDVQIDFPGTEVVRQGQLVALSAREFELLRFFVKHPGATLSRDQLLHEVWGYGATIQSRTVDVHVGMLRQKLEPDTRNPRHFKTIRGFGYKFVPGATAPQTC